MKNVRLGIQQALIVFVAGFATAYFLFGSRDASSLVTRPVIAQTTDVTTWEYMSTSIDAFCIQAKLTTMGIDGWEVFSMTSTDAIVDNGPDGKPHLTTQRFEITGKRKRR